MALPPLPAGATVELPPLPEGAVSEPHPAHAEPTSLGEKAYGLGRGLVKGVGGMVGDVESMLPSGHISPAGLAVQALTPGGLAPAVYQEAKAGLGRESLAPTSENVSTGLTAVGLPPSKATTTEKIGEHIPDVYLGGKAAFDIGKAGVGAIKSYLKAPELVGKPTGFVELGERIKTEVPKTAKVRYEYRTKEAEKLYDSAKKEARTKQAAGNPFAVSKEGQSLIQELEASKYTTAPNGEKFLIGNDKVNAIDNLINAIKGETKGGKEVVKELPRGQITRRTPSKTTEKDVDAIIEELRYLREVNSPGAEARGYKSLDANYKRDLINKLETKLYQWNPKYKKADEAYKVASEKLRPFQTQLMQKILKREKYDPSELMVDTERFSKEFFSSRDKVAELKEAVGNDAFVKDLSKDYVATIFEGKTPEQVKAFVANPENTGWLKEAGIYNEVEKYAQQANQIANRKDIIKKLGLVAGGAAIGEAVFSKAKKLLGF